jgi:hypothetical protein
LASTVVSPHVCFAGAKQPHGRALDKVTSTSVLVLPGARGHAEVSRKTQPTLVSVTAVATVVPQARACSSIPLSCDGFCSDAGSFTCSVKSCDRPDLHRRPHLTDLARLTGLEPFPVKGYTRA